MAGSTPELRCLEEGHDIDEYFETRFMKLKEIKTEIVFGTDLIQLEKIE